MNAEIKAGVDKMTPAQRASRTKEIRRRLLRAERLEKEANCAGIKMLRLKRELSLVEKKYKKLWEQYIEAALECPHPCCI